jgi:hypothetical protein
VGLFYGSKHLSTVIPTSRLTESGVIIGGVGRHMNELNLTDPDFKAHNKAYLKACHTTYTTRAAPYIFLDVTDIQPLLQLRRIIHQNLHHLFLPSNIWRLECVSVAGVCINRHPDTMGSGRNLRIRPHLHPFRVQLGPFHSRRPLWE